MKIRTHNEQALQINMHGGKADYKDGEIEKTLRWIEAEQKPDFSEKLSGMMGQEIGKP